MVNNERLIFSLNNGLPNDANLVGVYPREDSFRNEEFVLSLNSTYNMLNMELLGVANLGEGAIKQNPTYIKKALIVHPRYLKGHIEDNSFLYDICQREIVTIFDEVGIDPRRPIRDQDPDPRPDRKALDDIVFDVLGLTEDERREVYWSVCELVKHRLDKAKSIKR